MALDQGYIGEREFDEIIKPCRRLSVMVSNLVAYLKTSRMKGQKFKKSQYRTIKKEELDDITASVTLSRHQDL